MNCFIVDDEYHAIEVLKDFIEQTPGLQLCGTASTGAQTIMAIETMKIPPDVVFMDIDLPDFSGITLAKEISDKIGIVFSTSFREYGPEAFQVDAVDYLLKPFSYARFLETVARVIKRKKDSNVENAQLHVRQGTGQGTLKINIVDIIRIEGAANYVSIFLKDQVVLAYYTLNDLENKLGIHGFLRIHKSHIVNSRHVRQYDHLAVALSDKTKIPVGKTYRKQVSKIKHGL